MGKITSKILGAGSRAAAGQKKASAPKKAPPSPQIDRISVTSSGAKGVEKTVSIRPIENGFIVRESVYGPKGYKETEVYSKTAPKIDIAKIAGKK